MSDSLQHRLQERVKELTALHGTARLLQDTTSPLDDVAPAVAALLPPAWMHPDIAESRIRCGDRGWSTPGFRETPWMQREAFKLRDGKTGDVTVAYREERAAAGEQVIRDYVQLSRTGDSGVFAVLSGREREVLQLLAEGLATKEIADRLALSVKTVESHRKSVMDKLGIHSIAELTKYAIREGLTPLE
jgi:DNA-binding CsgD family transcriptional regulator